MKTRPVWTGFKIAVRHKLLTHNKTRLYTAKDNNVKIWLILIKEKEMTTWSILI